CGFEALIRYCNKGRLMGPVFLDIIERAGLAPVIDIWVCKRVKEHIEIWKTEGFSTLVSINLHPDTLADSGAIKQIINILKFESIMFEILEKSFIRKSAVFNLMKLQDSGFKISIDDYGTGYSNIESIINLNIDELKIDKSVISRVETHKGFVVCKHVTNLCHDLGIEVVAEGVETERQLEIVRRLDIDVVQGFYYSPAIPKEKVKKFVEDFNRRL
ncbi:MAG: EAL domain-containing protein, partial [Deferribacteres bacterium]|nr:EAL domain-containing protein [Deferribacteres bacterium]